MDNPNYKEINRWYKRRDVKFELVKQLFNREFAMLTPYWNKEKDIKKRNIRMMKCHSVQHFDFLMKCKNFYLDKVPYNMYKSVAKYLNGIPNQTMNLKIRNNSDWKANHWKKISGYDFVIDIDVRTHSEFKYALMTAKDLWYLFNETNTPFGCTFSGKGFHFTIPHWFFTLRSFNPKSDNSIYVLYSDIAHALQNQFSELIDVGIYDSRRLIKLAYSLSIYENQIYVAYPINMEWDIQNFKLEYYELERFDKPVVKRGQYLHNRHGNMNKLLMKLGLEETT